METKALQETFELRKFNPNDLEAVVEINHTCLPENYTDYFFVDLHHRFPETFVVALESGKVIGYIMCRVEVGLSNFGFGGLLKKGHVVSIAVLPEYRRKGVGKALINKAIEGIRSYNAKQFFLEVRVTNVPAVNMYKRLGFEVTRTIHGYYADGEDAYVMSHKL